MNTDALWLQSVGSDPGELPDAGSEPPLHGIDRLWEWIARRLKLCGYGLDNNWSIRFANLWFAPNGCACCTVLRAYGGGFFSGAIIAAAIAAALHWSS